MDLPIILSIVSVCISVITLIVIFLLLKRIPEDKSDDIDSQIRNLKTDIFNEFSRNRTEEMARSKAQRDELSSKLSETQEKLNNLTERNSQIMQNISFEINRQLSKFNEEFSKNRQESTEGILKLTNEVTRQLGEIRDNSAQMSQAQNQKIDESLEKIRVSNEAKLDEMRNVVDEKLTNTLTQRLDSSFKTVSEQLEHLHKALGEMNAMSGGITDSVSALNRVLTNVKSRGTWAEVQLKGILDQTIPNMYVENYAPDPKSRERVEFAIKIPATDGGKPTYLPLDSKFPMEDYVRVCNAADVGDAEALAKAKKDLEGRVLSEARDIRKYISVPDTTPFAIMYLASEGLYAEIASSPNGLPERLQSEYNIMIAGPTTITALLNSLSMGFKVAAINEKANEVRRILTAIKGQYETFSNLLEKAKKKIDEAGRTLDNAQHRSSIIQKKLKAIEAVSTEESDAMLEIYDYEALDEPLDD